MKQLDAKNLEKGEASKVLELNCNLWTRAKFFRLRSKLPVYYGALVYRDSRARHVGKADSVWFPQESPEREFQRTTENSPVIYIFENPGRQSTVLFFWPKWLARNVGELLSQSEGESS